MTADSENRTSELIALLSHELRTPMTSLQGSIELLRTGKLGELSEFGEKLLEIAAHNTDRLTQLVSDILVWYQLSCGESILFRQPCNVVELIHQVYEDIYPLAAHKQIQLQVVTPTSLSITADSEQLSHVLRHLLHNAIKFSAPYSQVSLTAEKVDQPLVGWIESPYLLITAKDQGIGIAVEQFEQIFQPFQQLDASNQREQGGLGLGLALCQGIVQQHRGKIWLESVLGQGSSFFVALPIESDGKTGSDY